MLIVLFLFFSIVPSCVSGHATSSPALSSVFVGGWVNWTYVYEPKLLRLPEEASVEHAHGIYIGNHDSDEGDIIITYKDAVNSSKCLLRWSGSEKYTELPEFLGPGEELCAGVPHGLSASVEENKTTFLYHANNQKALYKTTLDGQIIWKTLGRPTSGSTTPPNADKKELPFSPTWFASVEDSSSPYVYMADGYGSSRIYVYNRYNGTYAGKYFGGYGTEHGKFHTCHSISWDWRFQQMVVSDRENHRLEYFKVLDNSANSSASIFSYQDTMSFVPYLQRPCNIRIQKIEKTTKKGKEGNEGGIAIVPALEGTVGILSPSNQLLSVLNISDVLGDMGFLHPHDACFVPGTSGDFVLVTWNPGRIGYFRRLETTSISTTMTGRRHNDDGEDKAIKNIFLRMS